MAQTRYGTATPRISSTAHLGCETRGGAFLDYTRNVLDIDLFPWEKNAANAGLAIDENGDYIYDIVIVVVARQNGKTLLASSLGSWWLYEDVERETDHFTDGRVLGVAQNLAIAEKPWGYVADWYDPRDKNPKGIPLLQEKAEHVFRGNGNKTIKLMSGITYAARDGANSRGETASRVLLDEVREQTNFTAWDAISNTTKTFKNGQIWCFTSGGKGNSVVMKKLREAALAKIDKKNARICLLEWSGESGCALDDEKALLQANPSIGHIPALTVESLIDQIDVYDEMSFRSEILAQTIDASEAQLFSEGQVKACIADNDPEIDKNAPRVIGLHIDPQRKYAYALVVTADKNGKPFAALPIAPRIGNAWIRTWLDPYLKDRRCHVFQTGALGLEGVTYFNAEHSGARLFDAISSGGITLSKQSILTEGVFTATGTPKGGGISIAEDSTIATLLAQTYNEYVRLRAGKGRRIVSAYRGRGLLTVKV